MTKDKKSQAKESQLSKPIHLEMPDLSYVGLGEIAYVRPIETEGADAYGIFAANGEPLGYMHDRDSAMAATLQNDLTPLSVH